MMGPIGFHCQSAMDYFNLQPSAVKGRANISVDFHKRYLYMKMFSCYKFKLAKDWKLNWFRFWLFHFGSIAMIYTKKYGWIIQPYSVTKLDIQYNPAAIQVIDRGSPKPFAGVIGVNAEIIRMTDDFYSLDDLVTRYAEILAQIDKDINVNLMNANVSLLAEVPEKKVGDTIKEAYGNATTGQPLVVVNERLKGGKESLLTTMFPSPKQNYIVDQLLQARRDTINQFLTEIGIRNNNNPKKAQQSTVEISENNDETGAIVQVCFDILKDCFDKAKAISGLDIGVELRYHYNGGETNGETDSVGDVSV